MTHADYKYGDLVYSMLMLSPIILQVSTLEEDIAKVRSDLISKDDELRELMQQVSSGDNEAADKVKKLKLEKNALQAQLECKSRQLKVSHFSCVWVATSCVCPFVCVWSFVSLGVWLGLHLFCVFACDSACCPLYAMQ